MTAATASPPRVTVYQRPLAVMARAAYEPAKQFFAFACTGKPGEVKVVASGYGMTADEAQAAMIPTELYQFGPPKKARVKPKVPRPTTQAGRSSEVVKQYQLSDDITIFIRTREEAFLGQYKFVARAMKGPRIVTYAYGTTADEADTRLRNKIAERAETFRGL